MYVKGIICDLVTKEYIFAHTGLQFPATSTYAPQNRIPPPTHTHTSPFKLLMDKY